MAHQFVFIHGYKGRPDLPPWFLWAADQLQSQFNAITSIPQMPYPEQPLLDPWLEVIFRAAHEQDFPETTLIGHSLGGAAALRAIEISAEPAEHVVLIATPLIPRNGRPIDSFFATPWNFEELRKKAKRFTCMYSKDDTVVPYSEGETFARELGAQLITFEDKKHFEGINEFPEFIFNLITNK